MHKTIMYTFSQQVWQKSFRKKTPLILSYLDPRKLTRGPSDSEGLDVKMKIKVKQESLFSKAYHPLAQQYFSAGLVWSLPWAGVLFHHHFWGVPI